jgi:hypothetical protein
MMHKDGKGVPQDYVSAYMSAKVLPKYAKRTMKQVAEGARKRRAQREQTA